MARRLCFVNHKSHRHPSLGLCSPRCDRGRGHNSHFVLRSALQGPVLPIPRQQPPCSTDRSLVDRSKDHAQLTPGERQTCDHVTEIMHGIGQATTDGPDGSGDGMQRLSRLRAGTRSRWLSWASSASAVSCAAAPARLGVPFKGSPRYWPDLSGIAPRSIARSGIGCPRHARSQARAVGERRSVADLGALTAKGSSPSAHLDVPPAPSRSTGTARADGG